MMGPKDPVNQGDAPWYVVRFGPWTTFSDHVQANWQLNLEIMMAINRNDRRL